MQDAVRKTVTNGTPYEDNDRDGMADRWERMHKFDPSDPADGNEDRDADGHTNLEEFLNGTFQSD